MSTFRNGRNDYLKYEGPTDPTCRKVSVTCSLTRLQTECLYDLFFRQRSSTGLTCSTINTPTSPPCRVSLNRWTAPAMSENQYTSDNKRPAISGEYLALAYNAYNYSTERIAQRRFLSVKEISLMYEFPKSWIALPKFPTCRLLQATNLF